MLNFWNGHKTYIVALLGTLLTVAFALDYINEEVYMALGGLLGMTGLSTLRKAIATTTTAVVAQVDQVEAKVAHVDAKVVHVAQQVAEVKETVADLPTLPSTIIQP